MSVEIWLWIFGFALWGAATAAFWWWQRRKQKEETERMRKHIAANHGVENLPTSDE